ncbi:unnamed protein product [Caenorhabditis auriculariae]|uniref:GBF1-like tetratricopeptide repeats domain-containing protein n=1 Tax=Caenorhabditis auriculariae TaxID=2777116 RepID=A0A8S1HVZ2_9PELO|nr:unnamed protein product [Caenorhabditis auriculariae]
MSSYTVYRLSPKALFVFSRQISFGLYKLIRANAANVHRREHWALLFALLESAGAAVLPEEVVQVHERESNARNAFSDGEQERNSNAREFAIDRGYTSDEPSRHSNSLMSEKVLDSPSRSATSLDSINGSSSQRTVAGSTTTTTTAASADWIHLDHRDAARATEEALKALGSAASQRFNPHSLVLRTGLGRHEPAAFLKVCECLAFFCCETPPTTMVEASFDGGFYAAGPLSGDAQNRLRSTIVEERVRNRTQQQQKTTKKDMTTDVPEDEGRKEEQQLSNSYQQVSLHLLDLCSQLHAKAPAIFARWADSNDGSQAYNSVSFVWSEIGKPLLQAMARLSCDCRRQVRASALAHLQRAFLPSNMTDLGATEWQSCFGEVLFPLLTKLLEPFSAMDLIGMEDTRVRAIQIVAKTLLNHLTALSQLPSFSRLWLRLLDFMEQYLRVDSCGNLNEAVPESLKNMLLVLDNTNTFAAIPGLYEMTVERLQHVFPQLIRDTIPNPPVIATSASSSASGLNALGRVKIAPAAPEEIASVVKPSAQIDIAELTEVIVHSGATSPSTSSPPESSIHTAAGSSQFSHVPQVPVPLAQHTGLQNVKNLPEDHQLYGAHPNFADPPYPIEQSQNFANRTQENFPPTEAYTQSQTFPAYNQMNQSFPSSSFHQTQQNPIGVPLPLVSSPTIHGQYARANPLPFSDYAPQHYDSNTVTASSRSAFSQVPTQPANTPREPPIFSPPNESSYFTPIPYPPPYQQ